MRPFLRLLPLLVWGALGAPPAILRAADDPTVDTLEQQFAAGTAAYADRLAALAAEAESAGRAELSQSIASWSLPDDRFTLALALPDEMRAAQPAAPQEAMQDAIAERFWSLRRARAAELLELARAAAAGKAVGPAYRWLWLGLREDPENSELRRILGYEPREGRWVTRFDAQQLAKGRVWHAQFGWLPAGHVARYENGQRQYRSKWLSEADERRRRQADDAPWEVRTEHYLVKTTSSLEEGVRLATLLEQFHIVWRQLFAAYWLPADRLQDRLGERPAPWPTWRQHDVVCFGDRAEYLRELSAEVPGIEVSAGFYSGPQQTAYFYVDAMADDTTLFHEAAHQLFTESRPVLRDIGADGHFWIVEGIACYLETLQFQPERNAALVGGVAGPRLEAARFRLLEDGFYVPLAELCALNADRLKADPRIAQIYSQAAGLTHFLMHGAGGRYREPLMRYLLAVYTSHKPSARDLPTLLGAPFATLDGEYRTFLQETASALED